MDRKYRDQGLILVAAEVQGSSAQDISGFVQKHGIGFTVTQGIQGPQLSRTIPSMAVFDVNGNLVFSGHPSSNDAESAIQRALKEVSPSSSSATSTTKTNSETSSSSRGMIAAYYASDLIALRHWTDASGGRIEAALVKVENSVCQFRLTNGKTFNFHVNKLSQPDQALIASYLKEP